MRATLVILVVFLIEKDLLFAPFPYALRAVAQVLCLFVGAVALLNSPPKHLFARYWPIAGYLSVLLFTAPLTDYPLFVLLQFTSLASAIVFSIAYFEREGSDVRAMTPFVVSIVAMYGLAMVGSLILVKVSPSAAYESQFLGNVAGYEQRFRGMFSKAGMMGAAAGLLVGFAGISVRRLSLKLPLLTLGLACLVLTQSRTFWIASVIAGAVTVWFYFPRVRRIAVGATVVVVFTGLIAIGLQLRVDASKAERFARLDTISTLTGRTSLWADALSGLKERPLLGYGFTLGASGISAGKGTSSPLSPETDPTQLSRQTLHNGFIQCAMDAGLIGLFFYLTTMALAVKRQLEHRKHEGAPEVTYALVFLCVANLGESIIYSGAVFQSLCFWILAVFALSKAKHSKAAQIEAARLGGSGLRRYANVMR